MSGLWHRVADMWDAERRQWPTPGALATDLDPLTRNTPALQLIDQHLVDAFRTPDSRLIISMPPQEGKTLRLRWFTLWMLKQRPTLRVATASYAQSLADSNGRSTRSLLVAHQERLNLQIKHDQRSVREWTIRDTTGGLLAVGVDSGFTGRPVDCVAGDTYIECEHGRITAREAFHRGITRILAYDHAANRAVWRDVESARRIPSRRVVEIVTEGGRHLTCTPDHRVYTRRGYVPARDLRPHDPLVALDVPRGAPQVTDDAAAVVRGRGDTEVDVYDFQVAGTRNFFADGLLVHNCLLIDDPYKSRQEASSETIREWLWHWWAEVAAPRLAPGAPVILVMTRWHHDDIAAQFQREHPGRWRYLNIPAQADHNPERGEVDPLGREPGEFLTSARGRTREQWEARKAEVGPDVWAALFQGRPTPTTGGLFPRDGWERYGTPLWLERVDGSRIVPGVGEVPDVELIQSWDTTFKAKTTSDYVAGGVWLRRGPTMWLLDLVNRRMTFTETVEAILAMTARWPQASAKLIEDTANGPAIMDALRLRVGGIVPSTPTASKIARAQAAGPFVRSRNVVLPTAEILPVVEELITQAADFPLGSHDDMVDQLSQAVDHLLIVPAVTPPPTSDTDDGWEEPPPLEWAMYDDLY